MTLEEYISRWEQEYRRSKRKGILEGMRSMLLYLLRQRFGRVPAGTRRAVETIQSQRELQRLARRLVEVKSLAELGLQ